MYLKILVSQGLVYSLQGSESVQNKYIRKNSEPNLFGIRFQLSYKVFRPDAEIVNELVRDGWEVVNIFPIRSQGYDKEIWMKEVDPQNS